MSTFGFVVPAVPLIAKPVAVGIAGAATALLKGLIPLNPLAPPISQPTDNQKEPTDEEIPLGAANTQTGGGQPLTMGSKWTDKARAVTISLTATRTKEGGPQDGFTQMTSWSQTFSDVFGFEIENREATVIRTNPNPDVDIRSFPGSTVKFWKVAEPTESDVFFRDISIGQFWFSEGSGSGGNDSTHYKSRTDEVEIDGKLFPIPHLPAEKPVIAEPEFFRAPETEPEPNRIAPPLPGSPPPLPATPPLPQPVPDVPAFPVPGTPAQPDPSPGEDPATSPSPAPKPSSPPERLPASPVPQAPPALDPAVTRKIGSNGGVITGKPGLVKPTASDAHFPIPGGPAIRGGTANPSPTQIAQELSRVEAKLTNFLDKAGNNKPDWILDLLRLLPLVEYLFELFSTGTPATEYQVTESCSGKDYGDNGPPSRTVFIPEAGDPIASIMNRVDALSDLAQANFDLKVNTCGRQTNFRGNLVSVNFRSIENSINNNRPLRKLLRYRDLSGSDAAEHSRHWDGFEWEAGPVVVTLRHSAAGVIQCWAASESEGQRVIRFAASIAGFDPDADGEWQVAVSGHSRYGQSARMMVEQIQGFNSVSKRDGPSGPPTLHR